MNQTALSIVLGLLAGACGALAVQFVGGGSTGGSSSGVTLSDDSSIEARLDRIESLLERTAPMTIEPSLRGSGGGTGSTEATGGGGAATVDAIVARLEERLKPMVAESVKSSVAEAMQDGGTIGGMTALATPKKKTATLAEVAAELELTREEEEAVRRISQETADDFFKILAGKDGSIEDVRREFEDARNDPSKKPALTAKYMGKAFSDIGALITVGLSWQTKMKQAVGPEKASKIENDYKIPDLDPYGLEDMFEFD